MAYVGVAKPWLSLLDTEAGTYSGGTNFAKMVGIDIEPSFAEGSLHADNIQSEHDANFSSATVTLEVDTIPLEIGKMAYGHKIGTASDGEEGEAISRGSDISPYTGFAFHGEEVVNGVHTYIGYFLPKVQWTEGSDSFQTKGENITFSTRKMNGKAFVDANGVWRYRKPFKTEAEAIAYAKKKNNITE